ncbi:1226_t:CDS:2, partial [Acaulospora morrowiae]
MVQTKSGWIWIYGYFFVVTILLICINGDSSVPRYDHGAVLIGNKLYVYGGRNLNNVSLNELLILDVTQSFNLSIPPWSLGPQTGPHIYKHGVSVGGPKNDRMMLLGGITIDPFGSLLYYDTVNSLFVKSNSTQPARNFEIAVTQENSNGLVFAYGGTDSTGATSTGLTIVNSSQDTVTTLQLSNQPPGRVGHTATLLGENIYLIGGVTGNSLEAMTNIYVYNTAFRTWKLLTAANINVPYGRRSHRAVGTPDGKIIIYGGSQAIIAYGNMRYTTTQNIFVLDVNNLTWKTQYVPKNFGPTETANPSLTPGTLSSSWNVPLIVGVVCGVVGLIIIAALIFFFVKKKKKDPEDDLFEKNPDPLSPTNDDTLTGPRPRQEFVDTGKKLPKVRFIWGNDRDDNVENPDELFRYNQDDSFKYDPFRSSGSDAATLTMDERESWNSTPSNLKPMN